MLVWILRRTGVSESSELRCEGREGLVDLFLLLLGLLLIRPKELSGVGL